MVKFFEPSKGIIHSATKANQIPEEVLERSIKVKSIPVNIEKGLMPKARRRLGFIANDDSSVQSQTPVFFSIDEHTLLAGSFDMRHVSNCDLIPVCATKSY